MKTKKPTHLDLFCGPGGFATGFEMAGFTTLAGVDIHKPSLDTYALNHSSARTLLADIRDLSGDDIRSLISGSEVDLLSAGVPCEGFSMANRNRTKFTDERNFLFLEFLRIADYLKPKYLLVENVANLTRHDGGAFAREIEQGMKELGYKTSFRILDARDYGVPQRRRRVMFVGALPGYHFSWPQISHGEASDLEPFVTVGDALLGDLPELESNESSEHYSSAPKTKYQELMRKGVERLMNHQAPNHPKGTIDKIAGTLPGKPMYESFKQRIRLDPGTTSPTVVSGGIRPQFAFGHPTQARGLTIRERARLMSFPDSYEFLGGLVQGRVQTGDAVPPLLAKAVGEMIERGLRGSIGEADSELS